LNGYGRFHGINCTGKLGQHIIARRIHHPTMVVFDEVRYHCPIGLQRVNRGLFVIAHQATIAFDIGAEDSGEFAFHGSAFPP
jgi:hypothetical protein